MSQSLEIDSFTLQSWLENGQSVEVIDIRPRADYEAWHVPGSINVDAYQAIYANSPGPLADYRPTDDRPVVAVCYVESSDDTETYKRLQALEPPAFEPRLAEWLQVLKDVPRDFRQPN